MSLFTIRSGYDHVLLSAYLVPHLFEKGFQPQMEKSGNKVTQIRTANKICFRDVTKLLAPSTSLKKFGQLFKLEQCKAHFPFGMLNSIEILENEKLPTDLSLWKSDLASGGGEFGAKELAEAQELFDKAGCKNLGDYLKAYLVLDVEILLEASQLWRASLKKDVGLDFVESRKFTISSLAYEGSLKKLESNLRIGSFFPNNSQHYRLLRRGMRG